MSDALHNKYQTLTNLNFHPDIFLGRSLELNTLREFVYDQEFRFIAIYGEGGIGKTTLAKNFTNELAVSNKFESIIWTTAKDKELVVNTSILRNFFPSSKIRTEKSRATKGVDFAKSLDDLFRIIVHFSGHPNYARLNNVRRIPTVEEVLAWMKTKRILLIIDDLDGWGDKWSDILMFIKQIRPPSAVMITSRSVIDSKQVPAVASVFLGPLSEATTDIFVDTLLRDKGVSLEPGQKKRVIDFCQGNPLLIKLVIGLISRDGIQERELKRIITQAQGKKISQYLFERTYQDYLTDNARLVGISIALAYKNNIQEISREEVKEISGFSGMVVDSGVDELQKVAIIDRNPDDNNLFDMHTLAVEFFVSKCEEYNITEKFKTRVLDIALR